MEIHADNSNKQIHAKYTPNENKDNKQNTDKSIIILNRPSILLPSIYNLVHIFWPAFQSAEHEETDHALEDVVEVDVVGEPVPVQFGTVGDVDAVGRVGRVVAVTGVA